MRSRSRRPIVAQHWPTVCSTPRSAPVVAAQATNFDNSGQAGLAAFASSSTGASPANAATEGISIGVVADDDEASDGAALATLAASAAQAPLLGDDDADSAV